jgi:hypothetical protein
MAPPPESKSKASQGIAAGSRKAAVRVPNRNLEALIAVALDGMIRTRARLWFTYFPENQTVGAYGVASIAPGDGTVGPLSGDTAPFKRSIRETKKQKVVGCPVILFQLPTFQMPFLQLLPV